MNQLKAFGSFLREHFPIIIFGVLLGVAFLFSEKFAEFIYGALRLTVALFAAVTLLNIVFKGTVRPYLNDGSFMADFKGLPPEQKVFLSVAIIGLLVWASVRCFVAP